MKTYMSICNSGHRGNFRGLFAWARQRRWWRKHNDCPITL